MIGITFLITTYQESKDCLSAEAKVPNTRQLCRFWKLHYFTWNAILFC